jgi:hypothetical protein
MKVGSIIKNNPAIRIVGTAILAVLIAWFSLALPVSAAPPAVDLDQLRNGSAISPNEPPAWVNGNIGAQQGHYVEGYSIPYRAVMTNLPTATSITLTLGYDIKHSDRHAIDYLTGYDNIDAPLHSTVFGHGQETITPLDGVTGVTGPTTTFPIPPPDVTNSPTPGEPALSHGDHPDTVMTLFGGTISAITYGTQGDLTASQAETQINVTFTVDSATAVLAWGGHIGDRNDWGFDPGTGEPLSAGGISGSPYHMRALDWNLNNLGNQDRSLNAVAVFEPSNPAYEIAKTVTDVGGDGPGGTADVAGEVITYSIVVTNTGDVVLTGVALTDTIATLGSPTESLSANGDLDVGENWTWVGTYTVTQADIDSNGTVEDATPGFINNIAEVNCDQLDPITSNAAVPFRPYQSIRR